MIDLTKVETHFAFGDNWQSYARGIDDGKIDEAIQGMGRLVGSENLSGRSFLDIGCGSGLHSLAASRLGAARVVACDIDPTSVATTRTVLSRFAPDADHAVHEKSIFDLSPEWLGTFDVVYSWGVLHHTGDLIRALGLAANLVSPGGLLALALYRKTLLCPLWKIEKKWYANASRQSQERARGIFIRAYAFGLRINGRNLADYERNYKSNRGMDFKHDVHDWMGGYPYESMSPSELEAVMNRRGLMFVKKYVIDSIFHRIGVFGSGCDEFVFAKPEMAAKAA